jgi:hypothetical protein
MGYAGNACLIITAALSRANLRHNGGEFFLKTAAASGF